MSRLPKHVGTIKRLLTRRRATKPDSSSLTTSQPFVFVSAHVRTKSSSSSLCPLSSSSSSPSSSSTASPKSAVADRQKSTCPAAADVSNEKQMSQAKPFAEIPGPTGLATIPLIGARFLFKPFSDYTSESTHLLLDSLFDQYGPIVKCKLGKKTVLVKDVSDVETVFQHEGKFPRRPVLDLGRLFCERNNVKGGFNELQGMDWYNFRSPLTKRLLKVDSASYYLGVQNQVADKFIQMLSQRGLGPEQQADLFFRYAAESIGTVCFNTRLGFLDDDYAESPDKIAFLEASKYVFVLLNKSQRGESIGHKFYRNKTYVEFENIERLLRSKSKSELEKSVKRLKSMQENGTFNPTEPNLVFSLLSDPNLDIDDVRNLMNTLYVAGTDSTAKNLQVFFYNLAKNVESQNSLREEILSVIGPTNPLTAEHLSEMPYLKACHKESLRLIFPNMGISRFLPVDVVLSGYRVPAGTQVLICSSSVSKGYFSEPEKFLPERWLRASGDRKREADVHPLASIPFGHGPRSCIGRRFADQEMWLGAVKLLQKFHIGITPESANTEFTYAVFVQPKTPIHFTFTKV